MVSRRKFRKHLAKIAEQCMPGEVITASIGVKSVKLGPATGRTAGVLAVTNSRILFSGHWLAGERSKSTPLTEVTSIELERILFIRTLHVGTAAEVFRYQVKGKNAEDFAAAAHRALAASHPQTSQMASE